MSPTDLRTKPRYQPAVVGPVVLLEVIDNHPARLTVNELITRITSDPDDFGEVETIREAVRELRRAGLVRYRLDDQLVEPTQAALRAYALFSML